MSQACLLLIAAAIGSESPTVTKDPDQPGTVRVAVVNVGHVFNHWDKAKEFKASLEAAAAPYNAKAKALKDKIAAWEALARDPELDTAKMGAYKNEISAAKRDLEDLANDMRKHLGKKSEDHLVELWRDAQDAIDDYATDHGIELVLGYGDPLDKRLLDQFPNVNRKMGAMDAGSSVPLFMTRRADISAAVTRILNDRYRAEKDAQAPPQRKERTAQSR
jgi:Skp family chaperone for outer membrane proteins